MKDLIEETLQGETDTWSNGVSRFMYDDSGSEVVQIQPEEDDLLDL